MVYSSACTKQKFTTSVTCESAWCKHRLWTGHYQHCDWPVE